jgi:DNA invertase Pin-like site-specific DNA recombinase
MDDGISENLSISHQQMLLDRHIEEVLDIPNSTVLEFIDNGHSGVSLERPAVQEMLELVRSGQINCIVVKDFSRFSRNAMESGYYIEQVFPLYQVRFIAIGDQFDTKDYKNSTGGIDIAFKFLMHEYYSKDLSKKVRSAKRILMQNGEYIVSNAIYGYRKNTVGNWEIDPTPAEIVQLIFQMTLDGVSTVQIRDKLCADKIPTPLEYIELKRGKDILPECMWTSRMIRTILDNE